MAEAVGEEAARSALTAYDRGGCCDEHLEELCFFREVFGWREFGDSLVIKWRDMGHLGIALYMGNWGYNYTYQWS